MTETKQFVKTTGKGWRIVDVEIGGVYPLVADLDLQVEVFDWPVPKVGDTIRVTKGENVLFGDVTEAWIVDQGEYHPDTIYFHIDGEEYFVEPGTGWEVEVIEEGTSSWYVEPKDGFSVVVTERLASFPPGTLVHHKNDDELIVRTGNRDQWTRLSNPEGSTAWTDKLVLDYLGFELDLVFKPEAR